jgi:hypothetical protein
MGQRFSRGGYHDKRQNVIDDGAIRYLRERVENAIKFNVLPLRDHSTVYWFNDSELDAIQREYRVRGFDVSVQQNINYEDDFLLGRVPRSSDFTIFWRRLSPNPLSQQQGYSQGDQGLSPQAPPQVTTAHQVSYPPSVPPPPQHPGSVWGRVTQAGYRDPSCYQTYQNSAPGEYPQGELRPQDAMGALGAGIHQRESSSPT